MAGEIEQHNSGWSLRTILLVYLGALMIMFLVGNLVLNLYSARHHLEQQLQGVVQDTATAVALTVSAPMQNNDEVTTSLVIDAVFDRGDFEHIILWNAQDEARIVRHQEATSARAPNWFAELIAFDPPIGKTEIVSGWNVLGSISVKASADAAVAQLWWTMKVESAWFLFATVLVVIALFAIVNGMLRPLSALSEMAHAIAGRDFSKRVPVMGARELRQVSTSMNEMAAKIDTVVREQLSQIEGLRASIHVDPVTALFNRTAFDQKLVAELSARDSAASGNLLLVQIRDFSEYNNQYGRTAGDMLLKQVADVLQVRVCKVEGGILARRTGADFALYLPGVPEQEADRMADTIVHQVAALKPFKQWCRQDVIHVGITACLQGDHCDVVLANADVALRHAQGQGANGWQRFFSDAGEAAVEASRQGHEWQSALTDAVARGGFELLWQAVYSDERHVEYYKALAQIEIEGKLTSASVFIPMIDRFDLNTQFDRQVIERVIEELDQKQHYGCRVGVSLITSSVLDENFLSWLLETMLAHSAAAHCTLLEVPEFVVQRDEHAFARLLDIAKQTGLQIIIDRFGAAALPFSYLHRWHPSWIKLDRHFIEGILQNRDNQFYIRAITQVAHSQGIKVLAVGIEEEKEWKLIRKLGVDAGAGYHLSAPTESI